MSPHTLGLWHCVQVFDGEQGMSSLGRHLPACPPSIAQTCKTRSTGHHCTPVRVTPGGFVLPLGQPHGGGILSPGPVVAAAAPRAEPAPGKGSSVFGGRMSLSQPLSKGQCGALRLSPEAPTPPPPGSRSPLLPPMPSSCSPYLHWVASGSWCVRPLCRLRAHPGLCKGTCPLPTMSKSGPSRAF